MNDAVLPVGTFLAVTLICLAAIGGWITNLIWMFQQSQIVPFLLGLIGTFIPPLGVIHGVWLWFA